MSKNYLFMPCIIVLTGFLISGCVLARYGKLQTPERLDAVTIETLLNSWEDYEIHYAGLNSNHPSAVLFDKKGDDRGYLTERWFRVTDKDMLDRLVDSIQRQMSVGGYYPRLWKVVGPHSHFYGYMFTSWDHVLLKVVDDKTLFVGDLPLPPSLEINEGDSVRINP